MEFSIVVPTRNRDEDLGELLHSILGQTILPIEVIVVDDSDNYRTKVLIELMRKNFSNKGIALKYMRGGEKGLAHARNVGASQMTGTIYCGIDDDVILHKDYIEKILEVYKEYPDAVGVQGNTNFSKDFSVLKNAVNKVLFQPYFEKDSCRVRAAGMTLPRPLTRVIKSQWLSGTNSSYKREVLKEDFKWDENLRGYSLCEDMDISYRILERHPHSLYTTPHARLFHKDSPVARIGTEKLIYMSVAYPTYFFFKNIKQTPLNMMIFVWSMFFGRFLAVLGKNRRSILFLIRAYLNLFKNFDEIKNGNFVYKPLPRRNSESGGAHTSVMRLS